MDIDVPNDIPSLIELIKGNDLNKQAIFKVIAYIHENAPNMNKALYHSGKALCQKGDKEDLFLGLGLLESAIQRCEKTNQGKILLSQAEGFKKLGWIDSAKEKAEEALEKLSIFHPQDEANILKARELISNL